MKHRPNRCQWIDSMCVIHVRLAIVWLESDWDWRCVDTDILCWRSYQIVFTY